LGILLSFCAIYENAAVVAIKEKEQASANLFGGLICS